MKKFFISLLLVLSLFINCSAQEKKDTPKEQPKEKDAQINCTPYKESFICSLDKVAGTGITGDSGSISLPQITTAEVKPIYKLQSESPKKVYLSILTIDKDGLISQINLNYDDLPEAITISNPEEKHGVKEIKLTRKQIWRFLQYFDALKDHIERAWIQE